MWAYELRLFPCFSVACSGPESCDVATSLGVHASQAGMNGSYAPTRQIIFVLPVIQSNMLILTLSPFC